MHPKLHPSPTHPPTHPSTTMQAHRIHHTGWEHALKGGAAVWQTKGGGVPGGCVWTGDGGCLRAAWLVGLGWVGGWSGVWGLVQSQL